MTLARRINKKFTKWRLENTFTRKERLKCKKDAKRMMNKIKKLRKTKKKKNYGIFQEYNCIAIIRLANRGNKTQRKLKLDKQFVILKLYAEKGERNEIYLSVEEFLKQDIKVQETFIDLQGYK